MMLMCEEMIKLRNYLSDNNIVWLDQSIITPEKMIQYMMRTFKEDRAFCDTTIYRTHFMLNGKLWSVINGFGTYGGFEPYENKNYGLLELMIDKDDPMGWLTADDIINMINGEMNEEV